MIEAWLETHPESSPRLAAIESVRSVVSGQPRLSPPPAVRRQLLARLHTERRTAVRPDRSAWLIGSAVALVLLVALWAVVQPGIALQWSVAGNGASAYRIYRAPANSEDFSLLSEIPAEPMRKPIHLSTALPCPA